MSRRRTPALESLSHSAVAWFFVGLLLIAAIAGLLGQVAIR